MGKGEGEIYLQEEGSFADLDLNQYLFGHDKDNMHPTYRSSLLFTSSIDERRSSFPSNGIRIMFLLILVFLYPFQT